MIYILKAVVAILALIAGTFFYINVYLPYVSETSLQPISEMIPPPTENIAEEVPQAVVAPPPLKKDPLPISPTSVLTPSGIISQTNLQRAANGLKPLSENALLNKAAFAKLQDMFSGQYFAHVSPSGADVGRFAADAGFEFLFIGENLALGNFENDAALVQAWMDSPGHRANILNPAYLEIGAAAGKGMFEGRQTWLAVQIFGTSPSACPGPDESLRESIEISERRLAELKVELDKRRIEIEDIRPKRGPEYSSKVKEYNALVLQYNALLDKVRQEINEYNGQVSAFNDCLKQLQGASSDLLPTIRIGNASLAVEVADSPNERAAGLSGRISLAENKGMLFIFKEPGFHPFWMKDMNFPLDIIWIDKNKKIAGIVNSASPDSYPRLFIPPEAVLYVLEVNAGWSKTHSILPGMSVSFCGTGSILVCDDIIE